MAAGTLDLLACGGAGCQHACKAVDHGRGAQQLQRCAQGLGLGGKGLGLVAQYIVAGRHQQCGRQLRNLGMAMAWPQPLRRRPCGWPMACQ